MEIILDWKQRFSADEIEQFKKIAARHAVEYVESGMVVGLGTGSTTRYALERLAEKIQAGELKNIVGIPSSLQTEKIAKQLGIPLTTFDRHPVIDLTIDGADEVDEQLNLIKGGGGALLREKILAQNSKRTIIIINIGKISPQLGTQFPLPVEVLPFAAAPEKRFLESLNARVTLRKDAKGDLFLTDQENFVLDAHFGPIDDIELLARTLDGRAGIMAHGLFLGLIWKVIVGGPDGVQELTAK